MPDTPTAPTPDSITVDIIRHALQSIPDQIEVDITRTAFSPLIYEYKDYAVGMTDATGQLICQGRGGLPIFLANMLGLAVRDALAIYGADDIAPGDCIITNHAGTLGQHLNNVVMIDPVFSPLGRSGAGPDATGQNETAAGNRHLVGFMCVLAHWIDVGGRYVGSSASNDTTDIFQEGIQFRTVKLRNRGKPVPEIYRMIEYNTRFPAAAMGDVDAQVSGCIKGRQLFEDIIARYGVETTLAAIEATWKQSEAAARAAVRAIPDGVYKAYSFLDNDGITLDRKIEVPITVTISGERMIVDFSEISPEVKGPFNSGMYGGGITAARTAFKYLTTPDEPTNEGSFKPLEVILPPGKFLSAGPTAPLARYSAPLATVMDTIVRALAPAMPDRVTAGHHSNMGSHRFQGINPRGGRLFSHLDTAHGGWGGSAANDGAGPFKTMAHGDTHDVPIEAQEALYPLRVDTYAFRPDSGGAGAARGGLGVDKTYTVGAPCNLTVTFERHGCPPWGLFGGGDGQPGHVEIERQGEPRGTVLKVCDTPLGPGDRVFIHTGSGGGYGQPGKRDPDAVARDVRGGYVSGDEALRTYAVALDGKGEVDPVATTKLRARMK